jgi:hypothetical protein
MCNSCSKHGLQPCAPVLTCKCLQTVKTTSTLQHSSKPMSAQAPLQYRRCFLRLTCMLLKWLQVEAIYLGKRRCPRMVRIPAMPYFQRWLEYPCVIPAEQRQEPSRLQMQPERLCKLYLTLHRLQQVRRVAGHPTAPH